MLTRRELLAGAASAATVAGLAGPAQAGAGAAASMS
jgi:hypothetical protein